METQEYLTDTDVVALVDVLSTASHMELPEQLPQALELPLSGSGWPLFSPGHVPGADDPWYLRLMVGTGRRRVINPEVTVNRAVQTAFSEIHARPCSGRVC